ncbi:hypothetical protein HG1285_10420, partial [Hydrogenivirga sp. 128-5-R1-1]
LKEGVEFRGFKIEVDENFNVMLKDNLKLCEE